MAELAAALEREICDPALLAWKRPGHNLLQDLGLLAGLHAHIDLHHSPRLPEPGTERTWAMRLHEKHAAHWQQRIAHLLVAFEQFLRAHWL